MVRHAAEQIARHHVARRVCPAAVHNVDDAPPRRRLPALLEEIQHRPRDTGTESMVTTSKQFQVVFSHPLTLPRHRRPQTASSLAQLSPASGLW
jgi:hypothetical protein